MLQSPNEVQRGLAALPRKSAARPKGGQVQWLDILGVEVSGADAAIAIGEIER
jgi:hypothetical protein